MIKDSISTDQRARDVQSRWLRAVSGGHEEYITRAKVQENYFKSYHWSNDELTSLADQDRPAITLNHIFNTVQTILGESTIRDMSLRYLSAGGGGDEDVAEVLSRVAHQILVHNEYQRLERKMLEDGLILDGRGYLHIKIDYEKNVLGEIKLSVIDPLSVVIDPDAVDEDPETWTEVFTFGTYTLDQIAEMYGEEKAKAVEAAGVVELYQQEGYLSAGIVDLGQRFGGNLHARRTDDQWFGGGSIDDRRRRTRGYRVIERQWRCNRVVETATHPIYGDTFDVPMGLNSKKTLDVGGGQMASEVEVWAAGHGLVLETSTRRRVRVTTSSGNVLLGDEWSDLGDMFNVIPYFPSFRRGEPVGIVRSMLSPQDLLNKSVSQLLHDINLTANSGWFVPDGSLVDMTVDELERKGAKPGLVVSYNANTMTGAKPEKIQPNAVPPGLMAVTQVALSSLKETSGVGDAIRGLSGPSASGAAIGESIQASTIALRPHSVALKHVRERLGRILLWCMQHYYTQHRILSVAQKDDQLDRREEIAVNRWDEAASRIVNDLTIGKYDLRVGDIPGRDTYDQVAFAQMMEMVNAGIPIPPWELVKASNLPNREQMAEDIRKQAGMGEPSPEELELMQQQAQIEMKMAMAELEKKQAEVAKVEAETALANAKAERTDADVPLELEQIRKEYALLKQNLDIRMRMSLLSAQRQQESTRMQQEGKIGVEAMRLSVQREIAKQAKTAR